VIGEDGTTKWVLCKGKAVHDSNKKAERLVGASIDISEQKQSEKKLLEINKNLIQKKKQLKKLNNELEQRVTQRSAELLIAFEKIQQLLASAF
jgi:hypothetical protein